MVAVDLFGNGWSLCREFLFFDTLSPSAPLDMAFPRLGGVKAVMTNPPQLIKKDAGLDSAGLDSAGVWHGVP